MEGGHREGPGRGALAAAPLMDTHAHIDGPRFDRDRPAVLQRARQAGLAAIICVGADLESSRRCVRLARAEPLVLAAVGVHPHDAASLDDVALEGLRGLAADDRVRAIGETGLDYYRNLSTPTLQRRAFRLQIRLAVDCRLPLVVHVRDAYPDALRLLAQEAPEDLTVVLHCFSGDEGVAAECDRRGYYLSLAGPLTYPGSETLRRVAASFPVDRLLVETDAPYLPPQERRGKRNEPALVAAVAQALAACRPEPAAEVRWRLWANARRVFGDP